MSSFENSPLHHTQHWKIMKKILFKLNFLFLPNISSSASFSSFPSPQSGGKKQNNLIISFCLHLNGII